MHRTTIVLPDDLHYRLRDLGFQAGGSISTLLQLAALDALAPLLKDPPDPEALKTWGQRLHRHKLAHDKRLRHVRHKYGKSSQNQLP